MYHLVQHSKPLHVPHRGHLLLQNKFQNKQVISFTINRLVLVTSKLFSVEVGAQFNR